MTGFAGARGAHGGILWAWESKSVNGRGLDVRVRAPQGFEVLEEAARAEAAKRFKRGSLQLGLTLDRKAAVSRYRVNEALLQDLATRAQALVAAGLAEPARIDGLLAIRGVLEAEDEAQAGGASDEALVAALRAGLIEALDGLAAARAKEGASLHALLSALLDKIETDAKLARGVADAQPVAIAARVRQKLDELLSGATLEPSRLAQEAALIAVRADVREELDRLDAHVQEARKLLGEGGGQGRRLDFLSQELNREANTLCSKSASLELTRIGLDLKTAIDQFREQSQNVE